MNTVRFATCVSCSGQKPGGHFVLSDGALVAVPIRSLAAGRWIVEKDPVLFHGHNMEMLEQQMRTAGLPEVETTPEGDIERVEAENKKIGSDLALEALLRAAVLGAILIDIDPLS